MTTILCGDVSLTCSQASMPPAPKSQASIRTVSGRSSSVWVTASFAPSTVPPSRSTRHCCRTQVYSRPWRKLAPISAHCLGPSQRGCRSPRKEHLDSIGHRRNPRGWAISQPEHLIQRVLGRLRIPSDQRHSSPRYASSLLPAEGRPKGERRTEPNAGLPRPLLRVSAKAEWTFHLRRWEAVRQRHVRTPTAPKRLPGAAT